MIKADFFQGYMNEFERYLEFSKLWEILACPGIEPHPHGFCNISMRMEHAISMSFAEIKFLFTFNFIACLPTVFDHVNELRNIKSSQKYRYIGPFGSFSRFQSRNTWIGWKLM